MSHEEAAPETTGVTVKLPATTDLGLLEKIASYTGLMAALLVPCWSLALAQSTEPTRIDLSGIELHYIERGQGEPLILLHGGQGDYRAWQPQMEALSSRYRVVSYSRRYHYPNVNRPTSADYSALIDAADLARFVAALDLGPVHLVGTSYGAFVALAFAVEHPALVRSMVLAEPAALQWARRTVRGDELYREFMATVHEPARKAFAAGDEHAAMRIFIDSFDGPGAFDGLPASRRTIVMENAPFFRAVTSSSDPFTNLPADELLRLRIPVLLITGANTDEMHRLVTDEVGRLLPGAHRTTIAQAGHGSPRQNPDGFNAAVLDFLSQLPDAP